jgi:hypothetical protein
MREELQELLLGFFVFEHLEITEIDLTLAELLMEESVA